jgi:RHS repeat-associated protein
MIMSSQINSYQNRFIALVVVGLTTLLVGNPFRLEGSSVGLSTGKLSAQPSGGASYEMPIVVSPGTAGIQPKLSFQYSSGGRNGALGMGWSIGGLSAISRAPQTLAQDNAVHGVDLTLADRYSLDGQRLIALVGTDGNAGTEYRTEINSFVKVVSNGQSGFGPATFTAWTKSGLIYTYGGANGASFVPTGRTDGTILTWLVSKVQDQAGNYMTFQYSAEGNITSINYTMNDGAGLSSYASVIFTYATRPTDDQTTGYVAGSSISMTQRLTQVISKFGGTTVRQYDLTYESSLSNTLRSRLSKITEGTGVAGAEYPPTVFTWDTDPATLNLTPALAYGDQYSNGHWLQGDFNGDGICDVAKSQGTTIQIYRIQNGTLVAAGSISTANPDPTDTWMQGDFNGDGKLDMARAWGTSDSPSQLKIWNNTGQDGSGNTTFNGVVATLQGSPPLFQVQRGWMAMDVNGDGRLDIVSLKGVDPHTGAARPLSIDVYLNNPNGNQPGTFVVQTWPYNRAPGDPGDASADNVKSSDQWIVGDFNGDGLPDLAKIMYDNGKTSVRVYLNQNGSYLVSTWIYKDKTFFKSDGVTTGYLWVSGDFNGDGLMDLARVPKQNNLDSATGITVFLSTGSEPTKFAAAQTWFAGAPGLQVDAKTSVQAGDYNADGRSDIISLRDYQASGGGPGVPATHGCVRTMYMSKGFAFYQQTSVDETQNRVTSPTTPQLKKWLTADFNGDGKEDIFRAFTVGNGNTYLNMWVSNVGYQDLLRAVTDGMGAKTSIDYQPLTGVGGVTVYTPTTDAVAPAIDLIEPMPVVASITYDNGLGAAGSGGSTYSVDYRYEGLKADPKRGMLGFEAVEAIDRRVTDSTDQTLRLRSKSWLVQGFPFTGMGQRGISYLGNATKSFTDSNNLISLTNTIYASGPVETTSNPNTHIYFPYAQDSHVWSWDLNGAPTNDTETIVQQVDTYGNTLSSVVKTKDFATGGYFTKTTTSSYTVTTTPNWRIGQVTGSSVLSQAPGQADVTRTSGFSYNSSNGQVGSETIEPSGASWVSTAYEYDAFGNTKKLTTTGNDITARVTQTNYDTKGRFLSTTINALNHSETKVYDDKSGGVTSVTGPNGLIDTAQYDAYSRKTLGTSFAGTTAPINTTTSYEWTAGGNAPTNSVYLVRVTPDDGPQSVTYFDRLGREMRRQSIDPKGRTVFVDSTYDFRGRKKTVTKPYFSGGSTIVATSVYDSLDRVTQLQVPSVNETGTPVTTYTNTTYNGLVTTATNPKGQATATTKDTAGHLMQVMDALTGTITYTYDSLGQLIRTVDPAGNATSIAYDVRGRKISVNDPDLGLWTYDYYATGELKWQKDAKNQQVNFQYDQLGRITRRDDPTTDYTIWTYDTGNKGIGKLASVAFTPATGSQLSPYSNTISYDNFGRPSSQSTLIKGTTYSTSTSYDTLSRPLTLTYPTGFQVKNVYGANSYLTNIKSPDDLKTYWTANDYDADGHIIEEQYGNGVITDRVYIPENGLLKTVSAGVGGGHAVQNLEYHFDILGNLMTRKDNNQTIGGTTLTESFTYDALNRLRTAQATGQAVKNFTYDTIGAGTASLGNIAHKDDVGDYTYDSVHKHAVRSVNGGPTAVYDANGNMTSGFNRSITWTWFNQPQLISGYSASSYFEYDVDHQRVWQHATGTTGLVDTSYVGGFFEHVDKDTETEDRCYISAPTGRLAIYAKHQNKQTYVVTYDTKYLHKDHLGSVDVITNDTGAVLERDSFDAWGFRRTTDWQGQRPIGSTSIVSRGFTDHEELDSLGLVNMNGRIYDPGIGRFMSADSFVQFPFIPQSFNRYSYVLNNPLSFTDPSGFGIFSSIFNAIGGTVFGAIGGLIDVARGESWTQFRNGVISSAAASIAYLALSPIPVVGPIVAAFGAGFTGAFTSTMLSGASLGQAMQAGAICGGIAAATVGILKYGIPTVANAIRADATVANTIQGVTPNGAASYHVGLINVDQASSVSLENSARIALGGEATVDSVVVNATFEELPKYSILPSMAGPFGASIGASVATSVQSQLIGRPPVPSSATRRIVDRARIEDTQKHLYGPDQRVTYDVTDQYGRPIAAGRYVDEGHPSHPFDSLNFVATGSHNQNGYTHPGGQIWDHWSFPFSNPDEGWVWTRQTFVIQGYEATFYIKSYADGNWWDAGMGGSGGLSIPFFPH